MRWASSRARWSPRVTVSVVAVGAPEETVDRLYGLPLDEFTAERDAAAKELRADGSREAADAVRKLRKPSVPAWALNQLARRRSGEVERLIAAGDELRDAQEKVYKGGGARERLRGAVEAEREAVGSLLGEARELLDAEGRTPSQQVLDRIRDTLHAAATDERVRDELLAGRLVEHAQPGGLGPALPETQGDMKARAGPTPAVPFTVAIRRPGWTASRGAPSRSPRSAARRSRSRTTTTRPQNTGRAPSSPSTTSRITSPSLKK